MYWKLNLRLHAAGDFGGSVPAGTSLEDGFEDDDVGGMMHIRSAFRLCV